MLTKLRIENFKGWKDTGIIKMAPITVFFGPNSSGKSSIGQFLMMLKQTVESADRRAVLYPGGKGSAVQLGSYQQMVFQRNTKNMIVFDYEWNLSKALKIKDPIGGGAYSGNSLSFKAEIGLADKDQNSLVVNHFTYGLIDNKEPPTFLISMERLTGAKSGYQVTSKPDILKRKPGRAWNRGSTVRFYGFPDEVVAYHQNADFVQEFNLEHEKLFRSIFYLGPLRTKTDRVYQWSGIEKEDVGYSGEDTIAAILAAKRRKIGLGFNRNTKPFEEIISLELKRMELIEGFEVERISEERQEYEVKLRTKGSNDLVDLPDVGFGISQVLPVLVQCFYAPQHSIIIMEQPEIHLHPSAQAALADVMIDVVNSREKGADRNIQLIIETHSEHFLRRLQRRIAEDKVQQSSVSAYFADITTSPTELRPIEIDMFGNILNWPKDFFGDEMGDIIGQAEAAMRKRTKLEFGQEEAAE
jgi:predicted ATPase